MPFAIVSTDFCSPISCFSDLFLTCYVCLCIYVAHICVFSLTDIVILSFLFIQTYLICDCLILLHLTMHSFHKYISSTYDRIIVYNFFTIIINIFIHTFLYAVCDYF